MLSKELKLYKPKPVSGEQARKIGESIGVDFDKYDLEEFRMGLEVEQEHGEHDDSTGVTEGSWRIVGQIAWAHIKEIDDYYTRLKQMEVGAKKDTEIKKEHACACQKFWGSCSGCSKDVCKTHDRRDSFSHLELIKAADGFYIAGYASPWVVDDEGHRIEREALRPAFAKFMENPKYANVMVVHTGIQVGEVVQSVRDSNGKLWKSGVDKKGLFVICKLRDDIMVGKEVIDAIKKGELNSFSIRGRGLERQFVCENGRSFWSIPKLELYEITVCASPDTIVWTKLGAKEIQNVIVGDEVYTHKARWRPVTEVMCREVDEDLYVLTTADGLTLKLTGEHPVRVLSRMYQWVAAKDIHVGDRVSMHRNTGKCQVCGIPVFEKSGKSKMYCPIGHNRKGKTIASGDTGTIKQAEAIRGKPGHYYSHSPEGLANQATSLRDNPVFKEKCRERAKKQWLDPVFAAKQKVARCLRPNWAEQYLLGLLDGCLPGMWKYTGDFSHMVAGKNPDYWDGDHKVIELCGSHYHTEEEMAARVKLFEEHGYQCLVIWYADLRKNKEAVLERVLEFSSNRVTKVISVSREHYKGKVYNLAVEEDETYSTEALVVHNCRRGVNPEAKFVIVKSKDEPICLKGIFCETNEEFMQAIEGVGYDLVKAAQDSLGKPMMICRDFIQIMGASNGQLAIMVRKQDVGEPFDLTYKMGIMKAIPQFAGKISWMPDRSGFIQAIPVYDLWLVPTKGSVGRISQASDLELIKGLE